MKKHKITFKNLNQTIEVNDGQSILEASLEHDIPLNHACGGYCACTTCQITVLQGTENTSKMAEDEEDRLGDKGVDLDRCRLGCQTKVFGDITVEF